MKAQSFSQDFVLPLRLRNSPPKAGSPHQSNPANQKIQQISAGRLQNEVFWWPWNSKLRRVFLSLPWVKLCLALVDGGYVCPCEPGGPNSFEGTWAHKTRPFVPTYSRRSLVPQTHKGTHDHQRTNEWFVFDSGQGKKNLWKFFQSWAPSRCACRPHCTFVVHCTPPKVQGGRHERFARFQFWSVFCTPC